MLRTNRRRRRRFSTLSNHKSLLLPAAKLQETAGKILWVREAGLVELRRAGPAKYRKQTKKTTFFTNQLDAKHRRTNTRTSNVQRACMKVPFHVLPTQFAERLGQRRKSQACVRRIILHFLDPRPPSFAQALSLRPLQRMQLKVPKRASTKDSCKNGSFPSETCKI